MKWILAFVTFLFFCFQVNGQILTMKEAVKIGLSENLNLETIAKEIDLNRLNTGNAAAGMLPSVSALGDVSYGLSNTRQQFLDGRENAIPAGGSFRAGASIQMDWTVFDGMAMFIRRDILDEELELALLNLKNEAQQLSAEVSTSYQNLVLQTELIRIYDENLQYLEDLVNLTQQRLEIGSVSKLDLLQAKTDLNETKNARQLAKMEYDISTAGLNEDLNRDATETFEIEGDFIESLSILSYDEWVSRALKSNFKIKSEEKTYQLSLKDIELAEASTKPEVNLTSSLAFGYLRSNVGFLTSNRSIGPNLGVNVRYNLFDGDRVKREIQFAEIRSKLSELSIQRVSLETKNQLYIQFQHYKYYTAQVAMEEENLELANENFDLANELFLNGRITQYDLRQVRIQRLAIERRLVQARYQIAIAYIGMLRLTGENWL